MSGDQRSAEGKATMVTSSSGYPTPPLASPSLTSSYAAAEALLPASPQPHVWRHAAVEAITHTEDQLADLIAAAKDLSIAQQNLRRALHPLLDEAHGGQLRLGEGPLRGSAVPLIDTVVGLAKAVEEEMFAYAHEKTRHAMLLALHGVEASPVESHPQPYASASSSPAYNRGRLSALSDE